ncbi:hypothetical protein P261_00117 [Lachnospiraceae bacterium TWA4]|nr:hypothetical protein P261_00117 [Lachnospiraceae bacterium TWA4]
MGIGNQGSPYLGTALPLALVAAKYDFPNVYIISNENGGDEQYFGSARQSNELDIMNYLGKQLDLNSIIRYSSLEAMKPIALKEVIVYDTDYNFFNALWKWFKYAGTEGTLIHVVSPFYMMREYFAANFKRKTLLYSNNEYDAIIPNDIVLKRTLLASILASLADVGMTEDELMDISKKYKWDYIDVAKLLQDAILTVRGNEEFHTIYEHFIFDEEKFFEENKFIHRTRIKLADRNLIAQQKNQISQARMSFRDNEYMDLQILSGNIWNYYLPGQVVGFNRNYYTIKSLDLKEGIVHTQVTNPISIPDYFEISDYQLSNYQLVDGCVDSSIIDYNIYEATATKMIYGYISTNNGNDFSKENHPNVNSINNSATKNQTITINKVPVLEMNFLRASFGTLDEKQQEKVISLLCVLLKGLLKTLFPKTYPNIAVVPDFKFDSELIDHVMHHAFDYPEEDMIKATIPRIMVDGTKCDSRFIRMYIIEFSCIEYGMVKSIYDNRLAIFTKIYDYLDWYIASNEVNVENNKAFLFKVNIYIME